MTGTELRSRYERGERLFKRANLRGATLSVANLRGANLTRADLIGADLIGADLSGANLSEANLYSANLREANLRGADLWGADLSGANLRGANFSSVNAEQCPRVITATSGSDWQMVFVECGDHVEVHSGCRHFRSLEEARNYWKTFNANDFREHTFDVLAALDYLEALAKRRNWPLQKQGNDLDSNNSQSC